MSFPLKWIPLLVSRLDTLLIKLTNLREAESSNGRDETHFNVLGHATKVQAVCLFVKVPVRAHVEARVPEDGSVVSPTVCELGKCTSTRGNEKSSYLGDGRYILGFARPSAL